MESCVGELPGPLAGDKKRLCPGLGPPNYAPMKVGLVLAATTLGVFVSGFSLAGATEEKSQTAMPSLFLNAVAPAAAIRPDTVVRHRPVRIN